MGLSLHISTNDNKRSLSVLDLSYNLLDDLELPLDSFKDRYGFSIDIYGTTKVYKSQIPFLVKDILEYLKDASPYKTTFLETFQLLIILVDAITKDIDAIIFEGD